MHTQTQTQTHTDTHTHTHIHTAPQALPAEAIEAHVLRALTGQVLTVGQYFVCEVRGLNLIFTVKSVLSFKDPPPPGATADSEEIRALWSAGGVIKRNVKVSALVYLLCTKYMKSLYRHIKPLYLEQVMRTGLMGRLGSFSQVRVVSAKGSLLKLASESTVGGSSGAQRGSQLFSPNFSLEDLGIGGHIFSQVPLSSA